MRESKFITKSSMNVVRKRMSGGGEGLQHIEIQQILFLLVAGFLDTALMAYILPNNRVVVNQ